MSWFREVIVDILVTIFVVTAIWLGDIWMWWVIAVYTALLLIAKAVTLKGDGFLSRTQKSQQAPDWFLHLLYAINCILLAYAGWWLLLIGWVLIWLFSYLGRRE